MLRPEYDGSTISSHLSVANFSAPRLTIITCVDFSITARAAVIGFLMVVTPATAPASLVLPSMIEASSSFLPSLVKTAPLPALKSGSSSNTLTVASTASTLVPPLARISWPAFSARSSEARYCASISGVMLLRVMVPEPPCTTSVMRCGSGAASLCCAAAMTGPVNPTSPEACKAANQALSQTSFAVFIVSPV